MARGMDGLRVDWWMIGLTGCSRKSEKPDAGHSMHHSTMPMKIADMPATSKWSQSTVCDV